MNIFLTGASGFIGRALSAALIARGHSVVCALRPGAKAPACTRRVDADFATDVFADRWTSRLEGIDVIVNAVGIIREQGGQTFEALHHRTPVALFTAASKAGVKRVIQISALGANPNARSRYHLSKCKADQFLIQLPLEWTIVQPSLIYGDEGGSARLFATMASLPIVPLPGSGEMLIQPIHIDDAVEALVAAIERTEWSRRYSSLVGPRAITFADFLASLRAQMQLGRARFIRIPESLMRVGAAVSGHIPNALLDPETLDMLLAGNTDSPQLTLEILRRPPRSVDQFISRPSMSRTQSILNWMLPILRFSIAAVWVVTGLVSAFVFPHAQSYELLGRLGLDGVLASVALFGAAALDIALGIATLFLERRRMLWRIQMAIILAYTLLISIWLPEYWAHPYGPILKNLPMLAALWLLHELEPRKWNT